jgi:glycerol-3-phosphate acyltransferase PlsY
LPEEPAPDLLRAKRRRRVTRPTHDMLGDYLTALLVAVLGYIYPVYLCFKVSR